MLSHTFQKRVRYAEVDRMGFVYYGHYAQLYEIGRAEMIRSLGLTYKDLEDDHGIMMPVLQLECRYRYPAKYDDLLSITTILKEMPTKMIHFYTEIHNESGTLLNTGSVKLFFINMETNKRVSCPEVLTNKIQFYF